MEKSIGKKASLSVYSGNVAATRDAASRDSLGRSRKVQLMDRVNHGGTDPVGRFRVIYEKDTGSMPPVLIPDYPPSELEYADYRGIQGYGPYTEHWEEIQQTMTRRIPGRRTNNSVDLESLADPIDKSGSPLSNAVSVGDSGIVFCQLLFGNEKAQGWITPIVFKPGVPPLGITPDVSMTQGEWPVETVLQSKLVKVEFPFYSDIVFYQAFELDGWVDMLEGHHRWYSSPRYFWNTFGACTVGFHMSGYDSVLTNWNPVPTPGDIESFGTIEEREFFLIMAGSV